MKAKNSAPAHARNGCQRPKIMIASAVKPRWALMPRSNVPDRLEAEEGAAEPGQPAGQRRVDVALEPDVDADAVGGVGVLADGPAAQPPPGVEQPDVQHEHQHDGDVGDRRVLEERPRPISGISWRNGTSNSGSEPVSVLPWVYRNDVIPATKMLITVPAMIWSIFHVTAHRARNTPEQRARQRRRRARRSRCCPSPRRRRSR